MMKEISLTQLSLLGFPEVASFPKKQSLSTQKTQVSKGDKFLQLILKACEQELCYNEFNKTAYKKSSLTFLRFLAKDLDFSESKASFNPGGIAVPGDPSLYGMWDENNGIAIYFSLSFGDLRILYRKITSMKDFTGDRNRWISAYDIGRGYENIKKNILSVKE